MERIRLTKPLPGFTVLELLVAMALTSLTLLLGYGILRYTRASLTLQREQDERAWESQLLWNRLESDMRFMDSLSWKQGTLELFKNGDTLASYQVVPGHVFRQLGPRADTFDVRASWIYANSTLAWVDSLLMDTLWLQAWPRSTLHSP